MSHQELSEARSKDLSASFDALRRAAIAARVLAVRTNTAIVVQRPGQGLVRITAEELRKSGIE